VGDLLRRQAYLEVPKPLVVFTPKSLLRADAAKSAAADFTEQKIVWSEQELAGTEAHRRAAVAAAPRLEEHQRSVRGGQALDRRDRGVGGDDLSGHVSTPPRRTRAGSGRS